jgi:hypothetical protein
MNCNSRSSDLPTKVPPDDSEISECAWLRASNTTNNCMGPREQVTAFSVDLNGRESSWRLLIV